MKKGLKFLILTAVLALLVGAYVLLPRLLTEEEETDDSIRLSDRAESDITALSWIYEGESCALRQDDGVWYDTGDVEFPVDQDKAVRLAEAVSSVKSSRELSAEDTSQYGLDEPFLIVTATFTDGDRLELSFGDCNEITDEYYAACGEGVYMLDSTVPDAFSLGQLSLISLTANLPALDDPQALALTDGERTMTLEKHTEGGLWYSDEYQWFYPTEDGLHAANTDTVDELLDILRAPDFSECAVYDADDAALTAYGLDDTALKLTVTDEAEGEYTLLVGYETDGGFYARAENSRTVLILDTDKAETLIALDENALCPYEVCRIPLNDVSELTISVDGESVTAAVSEEVVTVAGDESGDGESDTEELTYVFKTADGELDSTSVTLALSDIYILHADSADGDAANAGEELFSVTYRSAGREDMTLTLYAYDEEHCLASFNGEARLLCTKDDAEEIREQLREAVVSLK